MSELVESFAEFHITEDVSVPEQASEAWEPVIASGGPDVVAASKT